MLHVPSLKLRYTIWFHGNYFMSCLQLCLPWGIPGSQQCCQAALPFLWPLWTWGTCSHGAPGTFPLIHSGHTWIGHILGRTWCSALHTELGFWITHDSQLASDCSIFVCQHWSCVKDSVKTEWIYFSEQCNYFPKCELWVSSARPWALAYILFVI